MINKEQYNTLQPYEEMMRTAMTSNYAKCGREAFMVMLSVYNSLPTTVVKALPSKYNCPSCALGVIKGAGKAYFEYQEWYAKRFKSKQSKQDSNSDVEADVQ